MSNIETVGEAEFLAVMAEEVRLPDRWDVSSFWLAGAQQLARILAEQRGRIPFDDVAILVGIGAMLTQMAEREREASAEVGRRLRGDGGDA